MFPLNCQKLLTLSDKDCFDNILYCKYRGQAFFSVITHSTGDTLRAMSAVTPWLMKERERENQNSLSGQDARGSLLSKGQCWFLLHWYLTLYCTKSSLVSATSPNT